MVRSIKENGRLAFTRVGGPILPTLDSELCRVYTRTGEVYEGTIFSMSPAAHVYPDAGSRERTEETMEVILDEKVTSGADTEALGIQPGIISALIRKQLLQTGVSSNPASWMIS